VQQNDTDLRLIYELVSSGSPQPPEEKTTAHSAETKTMLSQLPSLHLKDDGTLYRDWRHKHHTFQQIVVPSAVHPGRQYPTNSIGGSTEAIWDDDVQGSNCKSVITDQDGEMMSYRPNDAARHVPDTIDHPTPDKAHCSQ